MLDENGQEQETPENGQGDPVPQNPTNNPEGGNGGDPEQGQSPETPEDGLTDSEREEMTQLEKNYLNAQQKISADGDEKAELRRQIAEKDATINALSQARQSGETGNPAVPGATDDPYEGIDLEKLRQESPETFAALERQHNMWEQTQQTIAKTAQEAQVKAQKDAQYAQYRTQYGLTPEQFEAIWQARSQGNHFDADKLLQSYSKIHSAKRQQQDQQQTDRQQVVNGNAQSQPNQVQSETDIQAEVTRLRGLKGKKELDNAMVDLYGRLPEAQVNSIIEQALKPE